MQNEIALYAKHVQWIQHLHQFFCNNFLKKKLDILDIRAKHDKTCFYVSKMSGLLKSYTKLANAIQSLRTKALLWYPSACKKLSFETTSLYVTASGFEALLCSVQG